MSSKLNYRGGVVRVVLFPTSAAHPFDKGDLMFIHPNDGTLWPAADMANQGAAGLNQDAFQQYFAGVAMKKSGLIGGDTTALLTTDKGYAPVAVSGDFEFDCTSAVYKPGDLIGVKADSNGCQTQAVASAASPSLAIALAKPGLNQLGKTVTTLTIEIRSTVMGDAIQAQVAGSGSGQ